MSVNAVAGPHGGQSLTPSGSGPDIALADVSFRDVLRAINPLQYLPVIGTIYRASTGDAAPAGLRTAVSAVTGLLTGGPIGLLGSIVGDLVEQFFHVEDRLRTALGTAGSGPAKAMATGDPAQPLNAGSRILTASAEPPKRVAAAYQAAGLLGPI